MFLLTGFLPLSATASIYFINRHPPSGQYRVDQVAQQLRAVGFHSRESAGTVPAVLEVVPGTVSAFSGVTMDQSMCAVDMSCTESIGLVVV